MPGSSELVLAAMQPGGKCGIARCIAIAVMQAFTQVQAPDIDKS